MPGTKRGPITSPMDFIPGDLSPDADGECTYDGISGGAYKKGSGGKIEEVTFIKDGVYGRIPQED